MDGRDQGRRDGSAVVTQVLKVWIPTNRTYDDGRPKAMDGLNEIIDADRTNKYLGARREKENLQHCYWYIKQAMTKQRWRPMQRKEDATPVKVFLTFVESNNRRDVPNIYGGCGKYVLDALSRTRYDRHGNITKLGAAAIYDDNSRWMTQCIPRVKVDPENPGIEVTVFRED